MYYFNTKHGQKTTNQLHLINLFLIKLLSFKANKVYVNVCAW